MQLIHRGGRHTAPNLLLLKPQKQNILGLKFSQRFSHCLWLSYRLYLKHLDFSYRSYFFPPQPHYGISAVVGSLEIQKHKTHRYCINGKIYDCRIVKSNESKQQAHVILYMYSACPCHFVTHVIQAPVLRKSYICKPESIGSNSSSYVFKRCATWKHDY